FFFAPATLSGRHRDRTPRANATRRMSPPLPEGGRAWAEGARLWWCARACQWGYGGPRRLPGPTVQVMKVGSRDGVGQMRVPRDGRRGERCDESDGGERG